MPSVNEKNDLFSFLRRTRIHLLPQKSLARESHHSYPRQLLCSTPVRPQLHLHRELDSSLRPTLCSTLWRDQSFPTRPSGMANLPSPTSTPPRCGPSARPLMQPQLHLRRELNSSLWPALCSARRRPSAPPLVQGYASLIRVARCHLFQRLCKSNPVEELAVEQIIHHHVHVFLMSSETVLLHANNKWERLICKQGLDVSMQVCRMDL
jgi:hypothetical protein